MTANESNLPDIVIIMNLLSELFITEQKNLISKHEHSKLSAKTYRYNASVWSIFWHKI